MSDEPQYTGRLAVAQKIWGTDKAKELCTPEDDFRELKRLFKTYMPYIRAYNKIASVYGEEKAAELQGGEFPTNPNLWQFFKERKPKFIVAKAAVKTGEAARTFVEETTLSPEELAMLARYADPEEERTSPHIRTFLYIFEHPEKQNLGPEKARSFIEGGRLDTDDMKEFFSKYDFDMCLTFYEGLMAKSDTFAKIFGDEGSRRGEKLRDGRTAFH